MPDSNDPHSTQSPNAGSPRPTGIQEPTLHTDFMFRAIVDYAEDAIIANALDGTVNLWNASAERLYGYTAAEMIGRPITHVCPPDRLHEESEHNAKLVLGQTITHFVTCRIRKDGAQIDVSLTLSPVRDVNGHIVGVSRIVRDVTETQERYRTAEMYAAIVENSADAIISKRLDGTVLTWNSGATRIFGYTAAEMVGSPITRMFPADRLNEEVELIAQLTRGKRVSNFVTQRLRKNGSPIDVSVTLSPVRNASGEIVAISKIARDITDAYQRHFQNAVAIAVVEHSDDAIISKTLDGTVISWNLGATQIFGYTASEMIGGPITRLFPDDRLAEEPELISRLILGKDVDRFVTRRLRKDGKSIDVSVTLSPVFDALGQIVAVSKIAREVTAARVRLSPQTVLNLAICESDVRQPGARSKRVFRGADMRKRANRELRKKIDELVRNEQRFTTLVRLTSQVIWTTNPEGHFDSVQPGWAAFTGQSFADYQGAGWSAAVHPDYAQPTLDEWTRCVADRRPFVFEQKVRRHDGEYRTCTINAAPVFNDDGTIREWVGVHNDITERKQQEEAIRAQEEKLRFLTESMPQIVWAARPDGALDYYNERWFRYTGMTLEQTQGWGWGPVLHPDDLQNTIRTWNHSVQTGEPLEIEYRFRRASDGTYRWHLGRAVPLRDALGAIVKWFGTSTDIHDYKEAEARNVAFQTELEKRVRERTVDLERVGKIAGVGGWSLALPNGDVQWTDQTCRILDVQPGHQPTLDEAIGMYLPDSRTVIEAASQNCITNAVPFDLELELTTAAGRRIWVRAVGEAQIELGAVVRIFGAFQDITAAKLAERELFDQHELLRVTLDSIGDAVITTDAQGRVRSLNPVASLLTGWSAGEARGLPVEQVFDILDGKSRLRTLELLARALSNGGMARAGLHTILTARDGTQVGIEDSVAPIRDKTGRVVGAILVFRDVSERQHTAQALRMANDHFALAADAAGIGVWEWDLSRNSLSWDDQMYRLYGRVRMSGTEPFSLWTTSLHIEDRERAEREINVALRDGTRFETEFRIVWPSGAIRHLKAAAQIQTDGAGVAIRMIGLNFDITARKQAEMDLKQTSSLLHQVLDSASDLSIIATTPELRITVFNSGAERLLGYTSAEFVGSANPMAFHDAAEVETRRLELSAQLGRSVQGADVFTEPSTLGTPQEWTYICKDQARIPVLLNVTAMYDDSGSLSGYLGIARNITQDQEHDRTLQQAKSEADRANAAKSDFLANMSHEIRTPLNAIIGLGYLLEQTALSDNQHAFLRKINFAGRSLLGVINDVLDLSKIEAGEMHLDEVEFDLKHLLDDIIQMLSPAAHAKGLALTVRCPAELPTRLRGDATRLGQIATNLLNNAVKFTQKGRVELRISCSRSPVAGIAVRISVRDTGIGIGTEDIASLFKPFSQADTSTTRRFGGTGLGLSIAHRFVTLMGGTIGVTSTLGVGSEFWVEVPLTVADTLSHYAEPLSLTIAENSVGTACLSGAKILVVDDSDINREVAQHILSGQGANVSTSSSGAEALQRLRDAPDAFDVILMDIQMPEIDGNEVARRIRNELQLTTLPIIALTAGALLSERERSLQAGMDDYFTKPFSPPALVTLVRRHLGHKPSASLPVTTVETAEGPPPLFRALSQIDSIVARDVFGEDAGLFISLLTRLIRDFSEFALPVSVDLQDAAAITHLLGRLHKLRGSAGLIGATTVHRLAAAAEAALAAGQASSDVETLLRQLAAAFTALAEELQSALDTADVSKPTLTGDFAAPILATTESIARLLALLDEQNMDAVELLRTMSPSLSAHLGQARFVHLQEAVNDLRFALAATMLRDLIEIIDRPTTQTARMQST